MTKKRFGVSQELSRGLSETVKIAEYEGIFRTINVPLEHIELDPTNPRKLAISPIDLPAGPQKEDPLYALKQEEFEKLQTLAATIKKEGLLNPIILYKTNSGYKIVAGERRYLASLIAGHKQIDARVFNEKPTALSLKIIQWIENTEREDLSLIDRLDNIQEILQAYEKEEGVALSDFTAELLGEITGLAQRQSFNYLAILRSSALLKEAIKEGYVNSIDKAAFLSSIASETLQAMAIDACVKGASLKELKKLVSIGVQTEREKKLEKTKPTSTKKSEGSIRMGVIQSPHIVKEIIECVLQHPKYQSYATFFNATNWDDATSVSKSFKKMLEVIQKVLPAEA